MTPRQDSRRTASSSGGPCGRWDAHGNTHGKRSGQCARQSTSSSWWPYGRQRPSSPRTRVPEGHAAVWRHVARRRGRTQGGPRARLGGRGADGTRRAICRGSSQGGPRALPGNRAAGEMRIATCSSRAQADHELVRRAVRQTVQTWKEVVAGRKAGRELVLATVPQDECASQHAVTELMADRVLVRLAVRQYGHALQAAAAGLRRTASR
jgi:hypothetical protein